MKPEIILPYEPGRQNADLRKANDRLTAGKTYKDLSTVIIVPTRGGRCLTPKFVSCISGLMRAMNQQCFGPIYMSGMEVGAAFNSAIEMIQSNPQLAKFKYLLTCEDDNLPPPDGLLRLYESIDDFDVVGGLYWTKGEAGQPMIYGDPNVCPLNFIPQQVIPETVQRCNGTGMGFTLFRLSIFKKLPAPWFETKQSWEPNTGVKCYTQDLWFYEKLIKSGGKIAVDNRVKVGHYDADADHVW
jgi:hypothetical protein